MSDRLGCWVLLMLGWVVIGLAWIVVGFLWLRRFGVI